MRHPFSVLLIALCLVATGCSKDDATAPPADTAESQAKDAAEVTPTDEPAAAAAQPSTPPTTVGVLSAEDKARLEDTIASSFGKGSFEDNTGVTYSFTMEGSVLTDKSGYGRFRFYSFVDGGKMDIKGEMVCVNIDSAERRIWLSGRITDNSSTVDQYRSGQYATGGHIAFRARPNSMDGQNPAAIEAPTFVDQATAEGYCNSGEWSDDALYDLGENDLIAAIP